MLRMKSSIYPSGRLQRELRDLTKQNAELTTQFSELTAQKKGVERQLDVAEEEKQNIKQDLKKLDKKFQEVWISFMRFRFQD